MARCTAPIYGHKTASARANCPACGNKSSRYSSSYYNYDNINRLNYGFTSNSNLNSGRSKASWSPKSSTVFYTASELQTLAPIRQQIEKNYTTQIEKRDVFLCHAWDDREISAKSLFDNLENKNVSVWFSEKDLLLGTNLIREIDKGLANSRIGLVLVTPAFLERVKNEGVAEKELSALLARDLLVPIVHNTTFEALRDISSLLGSRSGLSTFENSFDQIASKISELIKLTSIEQNV